MDASFADYFPVTVFQKITVAECIETQSKAMMMLTLEQLSYLLKFALQKMKQPGVSPVASVFLLRSPPLWFCVVTASVSF